MRTEKKLIGVGRPLPAVIRFHLHEREDTGREFIGLGAALAQDGLIQDAPQVLRRSIEDPSVLELSCTFQDRTAIRGWQRTRSLRSWLTRLRTGLLAAPEVVLVRDVEFDVDDIRTCACRHRRSLFVQPGPTWDRAGSGIACGVCRGRLPAYCIPARSQILCWCYAYSRVFDIWYRSDVLEAWSEEQLSDLESHLKIEGRNRCGALERSMRMPVHLCVFRVEQDPLARCPECGGGLDPVEMNFPRQRCLDCRLAF